MLETDSGIAAAEIRATRERRVKVVVVNCIFAVWD